MKCSNFKIGVLAGENSPMLTKYLDSIIQCGFSEVVVLLDLKGYSAEDIERWDTRTGGRFYLINIGSTNKNYLKKLNLEFKYFSSLNDQSCLDFINYKKFHSLFNAGITRKLSKKIIESVSNGVINIHPGVLPKYRGCTCVEWAIYNDDQIGNTAHFMDVEYDSGPIISIEKYLFRCGSSYDEIRTKVYLDGFRFARKVMLKICEENLKPGEITTLKINNSTYWKPISSSKFLAMQNRLQRNEYKFLVK